MAHSFVEFGSRERLVNDSDIALAIYYLFTCKPHFGTLAENTARLLEHALDAVAESAPGCIDLRLDDFLKSDGDIAGFISVIEHAMSSLQSSNEFIDSNKLPKGRIMFEGMIPVCRLDECLQIILGIVDPTAIK